MNRKSFIAALLAALGLSSLRAQPAPEIKWGGTCLVLARWRSGKTYPAYEHVIGPDGRRVEREPDHWNIEIDETTEIGLRADGVLVWRKVDSKR